MRLFAFLAFATLLAGCFGGGNAPAAPTPPHPSTPPTIPTPSTFPTALSLVKVASGFERPLQVVSPPGDARLYVVEQGGRVWRVQGAGKAATPFLDVSPLVSDGNEQGLLSIAFDPKFATNGRVIVSYTNVDGNTVLARYRVDAGDAERLDPSSAETILSVDQPYENHNGGLARFGPDGLLYFGLGDGGSGGDPEGNGQNKNVLLGKLLRVDASGERGYAVPASNPFASGGGKPEVWDYGLRNPWRFSFDRATGDLWIGDVGQNAVEEIDFEQAGGKGGVNYGWNVFEGTSRYSPLARAPADAVAPVAEYTHESTGGCSVTGGFVYRGASAPALAGTYLYGDYCNGWIWGLRPENGKWVSRKLLESGLSISSFGEDARGEVYVVDQGGDVYRVASG